MEVTEHVAHLGEHTAFYLASGPRDGPLLIFVHGWPELALSWRHQLPVFGAMGFRAVAPDMRGYGRSSVYLEHEAYAQREVVRDMVGLLGALGRDEAVWVGHDWGSPTVWALASHHPEYCRGVASLCVPYRMFEMGFDGLLGTVDRTLYPEAEFPAGQWEYQKFYEEDFESARAPMEADPYLFVKALFRRGNPEGQGKPAGTAYVRRHDGWFRGADKAPDLPRDRDMVSEADLRAYAASIERNTMFGPNSYYMNHERNADYARESVNDGRLDMPVLFVGATYDYTCETARPDVTAEMVAHCSRYTRADIDCGHWMAQERPTALNGILARWLVEEAAYWPK